MSCRLISHGALSAYDGVASGGAGLRESHMGFMIRAVLADIPSGDYKGVGPTFGRVWRPENNATPGSIPPYVSSPGKACFRTEEWGNHIVPYPQFEYLRENSDSPTASDEQEYRIYASCKRFCGEMYSRYAVGVLSAGLQYPILYDTGDVQSNNWALAPYCMNEALALFDIGGADKAHDYTIDILNLSAYQVEATCRVPDMRFIGRKATRKKAHREGG